MLNWPILSRLILSYIPLYRRNDLYSLLLTSKSFYTAAEPLLYHHIIFTDVRRLILFATSLSENPRLTGLVHIFGINLSELRMKAQFNRHEALNLQTVLRTEFWEAVKAILGAMTDLESLVIVQVPGMRMNLTWILDDEILLPFGLKEVKLHLVFDNHVARFLNAQNTKGQLRAVQVYNMVVDDSPDSAGGVGIEDIRLPNIEVLDISLSITPHICLTSQTHLTHLQIYVDLQVMTTGVLIDALTYLLPPGRSKLLRGLSLIDVPASLSTSLLLQIATSPVLSNLSHLSHFHLPRPYTPHSTTTTTNTPITNKRSRARSRNRRLNAQENQTPPGSTEASLGTIGSEKLEFLHSLTSFHSLRSLELSLNSWDFFDTSHTTVHNFTYYHLHPQQVPSPPPLSHQLPHSHSSSTTSGGGNTTMIPSPVTQKILLSELKMYCPSLRIVVFWLGRIRFRWQYIAYEDYHGSTEKMEVLYTGMVPSWEKEELDVVIGEEGDIESESEEWTGKRRGCGTSTGTSQAGGTSTSDNGDSASTTANTSGGGSIIDCGPIKLQNAVIPGEWHCRMDANQWPSLSTLWSNS